MEMYIWVRETYAVVEPWDTKDHNVCAHDKGTGELVGEWPEGGHFPIKIRRAWADHVANLFFASIDHYAPTSPHSLRTSHTD